MTGIPKERKRLIWFLLVSIFFLGFVLINVMFSAGIIYTILAVVSLVIIVLWDKIPKRREVELFGIQDDWFPDMLVGIMIAIGIMLLKAIAPFAFLGWAVPSLPLATTPQWITIGGVAPVVEEVVFRTVLFAIFFSVLGLSFFWSASITSIGFSLYHIQAYAGELAVSPILSVSGAFVTAALVGFILAYVNRWRGSITSSIGTHGGLNIGGLLGRFITI